MDAPRSPRRTVRFLIALAAILSALPLGYFLFLHEPPAAPPPPAPVVPEVPRPPEQAPVARSSLKLEEIHGTVEVRRGNGEWHAVRPGEALHPSDAVRTLEGSYAVLVNGETVEVRMEAGTEVSIEALTDTLSRLMLANGMTTTRVKPGARQTFEVRAAGSDAVARTEGGRFTMSNNGKGTVAVGTQEGEVAFIGQGKVVIVRAGQQSIIRPGRGPSDPTPIPTSLLLKVNWPARPTLTRRQMVVSGQTEPGSHVDIEGQIIPTDDQGRFSKTLPLQEGSNTVRIHALSVGGLRQELKRDLNVDTTPPKQVIVDPGMWNDPRPDGQ
ncbi:FecR domain-containing protein [Archangium lipolyticum]|uniref:FecR domain-containing protein n=1 Tax=Archangium lipolyticum TaxID=2970465 RepID=UPI002149CC5B|nr:FecR domain-containing protein [Archangium lipolyticum]